MKIYITTTAEIGARCAAWAKENLPFGVSLVERMEDSDIFFSVFYNKLISEEFIAGRKKCLNFHGGILPEYRGSGTINWAIINGEKETGVTLHEIDAQIDHGPIIDIQRLPIEETDTAGTLYGKLEELIFQMFKSWFARLVSLNYAATPQDHSRAKLYFRKDLQAAKDLTRFARAFEYPGKDRAFYRDANGQKTEMIFETSEGQRDPAFEEFLGKYIRPYNNLEYVYWPDKGFIVWRLSTGENAELLHIKTFVRGRGYAKELVRAMIEGLRKNPPYFSVFGFSLASRTELKEVYKHLGFNVTSEVPAPYQGGPSLIFYQSYEELKKFYE